MPIQLLLDWSKALVAIVCSLLLAISFIMCTAKPLAIGPSRDFQTNRTNSTAQNDAIESEIPLILSSTEAMPLNISLNHNPFEFHTSKNNTIAAMNVRVAKKNVTTRIQAMAESSSENLRAINVPIAGEQSLNASHELNLATAAAAAVAVNEHNGKDNFKRHTSLAKTRTDPSVAGQAVVDTIETTQSISNQIQNAIQQSTLTNFNVSKLIGRNFAHSTESPAIMQTTHQSINTRKATIQSVFLDYATNFNGTNSQHINSINHNNISIRQTNQTSQDMTVDDAILSRTERSVHVASSKHKLLRNDSNSAERIERSANFSLTKATKRIQLLIKGRILQMLPDGTVNGTLDDQSEYTVLQRTTVDVGQIRLIGIATCLYLCMDSCGNLYSSREFTNDCIFNERLENNYNYYTSTHHSSALRTYYLALNRLGAPRKTHLPSNKPLGKLSTYAKAFTLAVPEPRSEAIIGQRFGFNHVKHGIKHLCESGKQLMELTRKQLVYPECNGANSSSTDSSSLSSSSSISKQQPNHHHIRHANPNHRRLAGPAALTDSRTTKNTKNAAPSAIIRTGNCNTEQCHKKRKNNNSGNRSGGNHNHSQNSHHNNHHNVGRKNVKKTNAKSIRRPPKKITTTTTKKVTTTIITTTTTTTESSTNVPDSYEDDLDYMQIASNGQTGLISDEDYENDK